MDSKYCWILQCKLNLYCIFNSVIAQYRAGAIGRVYLMNSPSSLFPSDIIMKLRGYYANSAMDIVEVNMT